MPSDWLRVLETSVPTGFLKVPVARLLRRVTHACSAPRSWVARLTAAAWAVCGLHDARKRSMVTCQSASVFCKLVTRTSTPVRNVGSVT